MQETSPEIALTQSLSDEQDDPMLDNYQYLDFKYKSYLTEYCVVSHLLFSQV